MATPTGHSTAGFGSSYCGYHGAVAALPSITYTDLPYMPDAAGSCGAGSANGAAGTLDGVSIVAGHELAETITGPLINGWRDSAGAEIADKCAWVNIRDTNLSGSSFAMQPLWSNNSGGCSMGSGSWSTWQQHGAPAPGVAAGASPVVASWGPKRLDLFVRGKDGAIWHQPYDTGGAGWYPWESMGGRFVSNPAAVAWDPTRLDLFGVGTNGGISHRSWSSTTGWSGWTTDFAAPPPGVASGATPTVTSWGTGRLDLFVRGKDNAIWHLSYSNGWSKWESLGAKVISDPAATSPSNGRIDLFGLGTNNNVWHKYWTPGTGWTSWSPDLPALPVGIAPGSSPAASLWQPNVGDSRSMSAARTARSGAASTAAEVGAPGRPRAAPWRPTPRRSPRPQRDRPVRGRHERLAGREALGLTNGRHRPPDSGEPPCRPPPPRLDDLDQRPYPDSLLITTPAAP